MPCARQGPVSGYKGKFYGGGNRLASSPDTIGKVALHLALEDNVDTMKAAVRAGYRVVHGHVGSMNLEKIIAAIETAARREGIVNIEYPEDHALYHSIIDALQGVGRGSLALGTILRTAGLRFSVVRGPQRPGNTEKGEWLAVALYGLIGGPVRGNEHECVGLGISHLGR
jgi:hut operon positive regulator